MTEILHLQIILEFSLNLWINTDFGVIVQDMDQPAFAYPLSPPPSPRTVLHTVAAQLSISTLYQGSSSISQATPSSVRNFIAATFDNVITIICTYSFHVGQGK